MSYNITGTTITLTRGDTFEALVSATKRDGTQYIPVEGDVIRFAMKENYDEIVNLCRKTQEPIFLTENGEMDLVIMDIETFKRKEKMLDLREQLLSVEEERISGSKQYTIDELDQILEAVIQGYREY